MKPRLPSTEACDRACARTFACPAVSVRGRCKGFPSAWIEVLYSQWDATKRVDGEERSVLVGVLGLHSATYVIFLQSSSALER